MKNRHTLSLFDTRTKNTQLFQSKYTSVSVYSCGPTVYRPQHIGNMRVYVFADTLNRALRHFGFKPKHVINLTDVGHLTDDGDAGEDKVEQQARKEQRSVEMITSSVIQDFFSDLSKIHIPLKHYQFPRATEYIREQIELIQKLESRNLVYDIPDGIYFDTAAYPEYGALGQPGGTRSRIKPIAGKKNPYDFALWKRTAPGTVRLQEWDSPWGRGFPGWHIECSAMAMRLLGMSVDIHTGGMDHIAVHHNNEIAQSEGATGSQFARIWMHATHLTVEGEKMAKSLNNVYTVSDLEARGFDPLALRYLFLQSNYHTPLSFSFTALESAATALIRLQREYEALRSFRSLLPGRPDPEYTEKIDAAIADNLNTAKVLAVVWDMLHDQKLAPHLTYRTLRYADRLLGILRSPRRAAEPIPEEVQRLLARRDEARSKGAYAEADAIRKEIAEQGYTVNDGKNGSVVQKHI